MTLVIIIFIPVYWALEPGRQEAALIRQQAEAAKRGAEIYHSACVTCHGSQGEGTIGPALRSSQLDNDGLTKIITRGVPGTAMPAWGKEDDGPFHQQQIKDLVAFIRDWDDAPPVTPPSSPPTAPSDIDGRKLFADSCSSCHGINREGTSGFAPALTPESLAALSDAEIKDIISNGRADTAMLPFQNTLSGDAIDALLQFIKYVAP